MPSAALDQSDFFHVGLVVDHPTSAMARISSATGCHWTIPFGRSVRIRFGDGQEAVLEPEVVFSIEPPHIEILQSIPGSRLWEPVMAGAMHHLGYFTDDVASTVARLVDDGFVIEGVALDDNDDIHLFAYLVDSAGVRIEIVDRARFGDWSTFLFSMTPPLDRTTQPTSRAGS